MADRNPVDYTHSLGSVLVACQRTGARGGKIETMLKVAHDVVQWFTSVSSMVCSGVTPEIVVIYDMLNTRPQAIVHAHTGLHSRVKRTPN